MESRESTIVPETSRAEELEIGAVIELEIGTFFIELEELTRCTVSNDELEELVVISCEFDDGMLSGLVLELQEKKMIAKAIEVQMDLKGILRMTNI